MPYREIFESVLNRFHTFINYAGHRHKLPAKLDPEDLYQEACMELLDMLDDGLDPDTIDFEKLFRTRLWNRMVDEKRKFTRTESRSIGRERPGNIMLPKLDFCRPFEIFEMLTDEDILTERFQRGSVDPIDEAETKDLKDRVENLLSEQEKILWDLIVYPPAAFVQQIYRRRKGKKWTRSKVGVKVWGQYLGWPRRKISDKIKSIRNAVVTALGDDVPEWIERKLTA